MVVITIHTHYYVNLSTTQKTKLETYNHPGMCFLHKLKKFVDDCLQKPATHSVKCTSMADSSQETNEPPMCEEEAWILPDHIHDVACNHLCAIVCDYQSMCGGGIP